MTMINDIFCLLRSSYILMDLLSTKFKCYVNGYAFFSRENIFTRNNVIQMEQILMVTQTNIGKWVRARERWNEFTLSAWNLFLYLEWSSAHITMTNKVEAAANKKILLSWWKRMSTKWFIRIVQLLPFFSFIATVERKNPPIRSKERYEVQLIKQKLWLLLKKNCIYVYIWTFH